MLLHFRYTSNELRNGLIDHFLFCLKNNDIEAIQSYQYELAPDFLYELHGVNDIGTYLHKMRYSASTNIKESDRGLWGDTFCIRWLAKWIDISIAVWSLTRKTRYLLFNQHENAIPYCILFHDANPVSGHYEPLVYQKFPICICNESNIYLSPICKDIESHWMHIANNMLLNGLTIAKQVTSNCGDSLFNVICYLVATEFNAECLRLYIVQSFCNALMHKNQEALHCLEQYLVVYAIHYTMNSNWQQYLINMAMSYEKGQVEGGPFCLQWISVIFKVNIQVWSFVANNFVNYSSAYSRCNDIVNIFSFMTNTSHIHYHAMIQEYVHNSQQLHMEANDVCNQLRHKHILEKEQCISHVHFSNNIAFEIACHLDQMQPTKDCRLNYHKLKQFIRTKRKCNDKCTKPFSNKKSRITRKKNAIQIYMEKVEDTPRNTCAVCNKFHFAKNIRFFTIDLQEKHMNLTLNNRTFSNENICVSCKKPLENGKLPQFATPEQIRRNISLPTVNILSDLEERLVSLRIAFAQIRQWGHRRSQIGLTGSIINVSVHMDIVQKSLPQYLNDTMTIAVALKRRLQYKNAYQAGKVHPIIVMKALNELCSRSLYKASNICINENWAHVL